MNDQVARLKRFNLPVPVKFRALGEQEWHSATAENVSASGALISGGDRLAVGAEVELWLLMRSCNSSAADIVCPSVVVRCEKPDKTEEQVGLGIKFRRFKFRPAQ